MVRIRLSYMYNNLFVVLEKKRVILSPITCAYLYNNSVVGEKKKWYDSNYNFKIYLLIYISPIECTFQKKSQVLKGYGYGV